MEQETKGHIHQAWLSLLGENESFAGSLSLLDSDQLGRLRLAIQAELARRRTKKNAALIEAARNQNPTLEIDPDAIVSRPHEDDEGGAYVQAWVWVEDEGEGEEG